MSPVTYKEKVMMLLNGTLTDTCEHDTCFLCGGSNQSTDMGKFVMIHCPNDDCSNHHVMTLPVIHSEEPPMGHDVVVYQRKFRFV